MRTIKRRRKEKKTDYKARLEFLKSERPRIVIRKTGKYIITQLVNHKEAQDFVKATVTSKDLLKYGWPKEWAGSLKSVPAAYLTGFLFGRKIIDKKLGKEVIVDIGLVKSIKGSRIYAVIRGLKEAGVSIKCKEEMYPKEERIKGMHMKKDIVEILNKVKENMERS